MPSKKRKIAVVGNWKMNHGPAATLNFFSELTPLLKKLSQEISKKADSDQDSTVHAAVCVPFVSMGAALLAVNQSPAQSAPQKNLSQKVNPQTINVEICAQNVHWENAGAFTGETSPAMLKELGIKTTLIGHSERRQFFGETNQSVQKRVEGALANGLNVIFCIGESRQEREAGQTESVLTTQLEILRSDGPAATALGRADSERTGLDSKADGPSLWIAYEPVWAIGTGLTATPLQAQEAHAFIRGWLATRFGAATAQKTILLYGGSATPQNFKDLLLCEDVDGGLVGGASLKPQSFMDLVTIAIGTCAGDNR